MLLVFGEHKMKANLGRFLFRADAFQSVLDADGASKLGCYTPFGFSPNVKGAKLDWPITANSFRFQERTYSAMGTGLTTLC